MFCLVGGIGLVVDTAVLGLLASPSGFGWSVTISKIVAAEIAVVNNFVWNDLWTFRNVNESRGEPGAVPVLSRFGKFNLIYVFGIGFSVALLWLQTSLFKMNLFLANFITIVLVSFWNFAMAWRFARSEPTNE